MNPKDILSMNHDIHMHSRDFSDGKHSVQEVVRFAARWQNCPRWVGISDHSPLEDERLHAYIHELKLIQEELSSIDGIDLLAGMELEWGATGPVCHDLVLKDLDYVISAYHGRKFSNADQVESYFKLLSKHLFSDIVAHPDRFLGNVDTSNINWEKVFVDFAEHKVLCEYNLTTPLRPEIFDAAAKRSEVRFVITTDTHDFRNIAIRRVIDAWSELLGGGFELAREYLVDLLRRAGSPAQLERLAELFGSPQLLDGLQQHLYKYSLSLHPETINLSPDEETLIQILGNLPECDLDMDFLANRLVRFSTMPAEKIISSLDLAGFRETIKVGRQERASYCLL